MEKFLTYRAIFAFAIPTIAIVTLAIILIVLALILLLAVFLSGRRHRKMGIPQRESWPQTLSFYGQAPVIPPPSGKALPDSMRADAGITPTPTADTNPVRQIPFSTPARFVLHSTTGEVLQEFPLEKPEISIGRASSNDISLSQDKRTSRYHATIQYENGQYILRDERSANGTFVNGQPLEEMTSRVLQDGDHVRIGEHEFTFHGFSSAPVVEDMPTLAVQLPAPPSESRSTLPAQGGKDYCPHCGAEKPPRSVFCPKCGNHLYPANSSPQQAPVESPPWTKSVPAVPEQRIITSPAPLRTSILPKSPAPQRSSIPPPSIMRSGTPTSPADVDAGASTPKSATPVYSPEQLRFTAFHPKEVIVETWNTLLVYTYIESVVEAINKDAQRFKAELGAAPRKISKPATQLLLRQTNISIVPECKGVTFNPRRFTFKWLEDWHRASFRFQAKTELAGSAANGRINIFAGPLLVGTLKMALLFAEPDTLLPPQIDDAVEMGQLYKQIFASYSHDDSLIVLTCRDVFKTLGYNTLIDIDTLRAGQKFSDALKRMIDAADIFQLFWSERSAQSRYVAEEWQYALDLNRGEGFVRPVYWEVPMAKPPEKLAPLHFAYLPVDTFTRQHSPSR